MSSAAANDVDAELLGALDRARAAWPGVSLSDASFVNGLRERLPPVIEVKSVATTHVEDLFLALACAEGDPVALSHFEQHLVPDLRRSLLGMGLSETVTTDAIQAMRQELFVASAGAKPKILGYSARGALRGWLRAVGGRTGVRLARVGGFAAELDASFADPADDPELDYLKRKYSASFEEAFQAALLSMEASDRLLLKQRFRHGLGLDELGRLYGVHASTISRRVTDARERLIAETREGMMRTLKLSHAEVSSIVRLIRSHLDLSLSQHLAPDADGSLSHGAA